MKKGNISGSENLKFLHEMDVYKEELRMQSEELFLAANRLKLVEVLESSIEEIRKQNEELKLVKEKAVIASKKYTELYAFAPSGIFTLSREGDIVELNLTGAMMLCKERQRLKKSRFGLFVADDFKTIFNLFFEKIFSSTRSEICEVALSVKGNTIYVILTGIVTGIGVQCFLTMVDITERKHAAAELVVANSKLLQLKDALHETNSYLENIIDNANGPIIIWNKRFLITRVNRAFEFLTGRSEAEVIGESLNALFPPPSVANSMDLINSSLAGMKSEAVEIEIRHRDGTIRTVLWNSTLIFESDGRTPFATLAQLQDITLRKQAEKALMESEEKWRTLYEILPVGVLILDKKGNISESNKALSHILGISEDSLQNGLFTDRKYINQDNKPMKFAEFPSSLAIDEQRVIRNVEVGIVKDDGNTIWTEVSAAPISLPDAKCVIVTTDVTERKRAELLIKNQNLELQKLNSDKDRFLSILGHDLRSPFNALLGLSELLKENIRTYDQDEIEVIAKHINQSAIKAHNLQEDILIWSRSQFGKIPFRPQNLNLKETCLDCIKFLTPEAEAKRIVLSVLVKEETTIFADTDMLKTIIRNLVSNAIKFTNMDGAINISAEQKSKNVTISVSDNGLGIKHETLAGLFDISQINTTTGTEGETGTGLGLLICKELAEKHGGAIWVESVYGKGSVFHFTFPGSKT